MARGLGLELSSVPGTEGPGKQGGTGWWPSALAGEPRRVERDRGDSGQGGQLDSIPRSMFSASLPLRFHLVLQR